MISFYQAFILGLLQGISELFPISSLGHSVILPKLFGWQIEQNSNYFLSFLVATHFATALVLFIFFWSDWKKIILGILNSLKDREIKTANIYGRLGWLIIIGTIPAGVIGLLFEESLKALFATPIYASLFLICNGGILFLAEVLRKKSNQYSDIKNSDERISKIGFLNPLKVGALQAIALIPGFSRTGSAMTGGLLIGLSHEDAARFSFLLATPIIAAAAVLKLPEMVFSGSQMILSILIGAISSAVGAFFAVKFLVKYFQTETLKPFAIYCVVAGIIFYIILSSFN